MNKTALKLLLVATVCLSCVLAKVPLFKSTNFPPNNYTSCPNTRYNPELHADNVFEVDLDKDIVSDLYAEYVKDVKPYLETGKSTDNFCLVTPYNPETSTWRQGNEDNEFRSDIKWYSVNNEATYKKYVNHVERLGLPEMVKGSWIDSDKVTVYTIFLIVRSHSVTPHFHVDWDEEAYTQIMTFLIPLNDFDIHLKYFDADGEIDDYEYKFGKGIGFSGGFFHSTGIGKGEEEDVLLCVYMGSDDDEIWDIALGNINDELEHYMNPKKGYIRNENIRGMPSKCQ